jgi:transposase
MIKNNMIDPKTAEKIRALDLEGQSPAEISRLLGISYPTIKKYVSLKKTEGFPIPINNQDLDSPKKVSKLIEPFQKQIDYYIHSQKVSSSRKIERLLRGEGYKGSYPLLNTYIQGKRADYISSKTNSYLRIETEPGEQAQVDWGHFGHIITNGTRLNLYVFVFVLSHSRAMYAEFVTSQRQKILQDCHIRAFKYLGGTPRKIRYDNMKTIIISRNKTPEEEIVNWNFEFKNFAKHYHFQPEVCPRYYPRSKGKVEAAVKHIRNNFFDAEQYGKTFSTLTELNEKLSKCLNDYANCRIHPTKKESVLEAWNHEKHLLFNISDYPPFNPITPEIRRVSRISMVNYKKASYWVPKEYIQHKIEVREITRDGLIFLEFHSKDKKIYEHTMDKSGGWKLPSDRELIKTGSKIRQDVQEIKKRVLDNPMYKTEVQRRDLEYYSKLKR